MTEKFLGVIERSSLVARFLVADSALKAGNVRRLLSRSIGSGNSRVLVAGDVSGLKSAVDAGAEAADGCLIGSIVITSIYPMRSPRLAERRSLRPAARRVCSNRSISPP